tara:strand:- start:23 stop:328 length:306 start_codon:yes stop_codon:yes gene_type:complete
LSKRHTNSGLPHINPDTIESIVEEVFTKNEDFGIKEFMSSLEKENREMCYILYCFIDSIADWYCHDDEEQREEFCAIAKISCHLMYKSMEKQLEIDRMQDG